MFVAADMKAEFSRQWRIGVLSAAERVSATDRSLNAMYQETACMYDDGYVRAGYEEGDIDNERPESGLMPLARGFEAVRGGARISPGCPGVG